VRLSQKPTKQKQVGSVTTDDKGLKERWKVAHGRRERLGYTAERLSLEIEQKVSPLQIPDRLMGQGTAIANEFESGVPSVSIMGVENDIHESVPPAGIQFKQKAIKPFKAPPNTLIFCLNIYSEADV
jgi:hypothetical protein